MSCLLNLGGRITSVNRIDMSYKISDCTKFSKIKKRKLIIDDLKTNLVLTYFVQRILE